MQNHNIQINDRRANAAINEEDVHRLARAMSGWYVRMDGKYYDASDPKNKYSRDDVQAASTFRFQEDYPEIPLSDELLREVFETALTKKTFDRSLAVPTWNGKVQCLPGQQDRFSWKHGMVTINTWTEPAYRSVEGAEGALGTIGDFLDFIFDTEREKDIFLNWLAWCLQNEDQKPTWGPLLYSKSKGTGKKHTVRHRSGTVRQGQLNPPEQRRQADRAIQPSGLAVQAGDLGGARHPTRH